jgi:hypothetical protein
LFYEAVIAVVIFVSTTVVVELVSTVAVGTPGVPTTGIIEVMVVTDPSITRVTATMTLGVGVAEISLTVGVVVGAVTTTPVVSLMEKPPMIVEVFKDVGCRQRRPALSVTALERSNLRRKIPTLPLYALKQIGAFLVPS